MKKVKNKRIGIILGRFLLENHLSYYEELIDCIASFEITIYGDEWFRDKIKGVNFVSHNKNDYYFSFLFKNLRAINKFEAVIIDENIGNPYLFYLFLNFIKVKIYFTVHNVNHWFLHVITLRNIHSIIIRHLIIKRVKNYIVISPNLKLYLASLLKSSKNVFFIPFASSQTKEIEKKENNIGEIIFSIPGKVDENRRNYEIVFSAYYKALKVNKNIKLVLLGKLDRNSNLYSRVQSINKEFLNAIIFFEDYISQTLYDDYLLKSDYFIANTNQFKNDDVFMEIYGTSKESGFLFLAIKYGLKVLSPHYYIFPEVLNDISVTFSNEQELYNHFVNLKKNNQVLQISQYQHLVKKERDYLLNNIF
jgi:hypothetical protein